MSAKIIIATHGRFAEGILSSAELILGKQKNVQYINCYTDHQVNYEKLFKKIIVDHDYEKEQLVVITDLLGGSVNNEFMKYVKDYSFFLISGLNLSLLLELLMKSEELNINSINEMIENSKSFIACCNNIDCKEEDADF